MRVAAIVSNIGALLFELALFARYGIGDTPAPGKWLFGTLVLAQLTSLIALRSAGADDLLSLVMRRKALEERNRIRELENRVQSEPTSPKPPLSKQ
jgi:hypothetical protein